MTGTTPALDEVRGSLPAFADAVGPSTLGHALSDAQARALVLDRPIVVLVTPRQTGKSDSLALLAVHHAFAHPRSRVLIVSAGEDAARRLLGRVRAIAAHPLLAGSVVDEGQSLVVLTNGSEIRSVPASEKQVRGWTVDLLLVDEAAMVDSELLLSAAIPTTAARADARIVLASVPWATSGAYYDLAMQGADGGTEHVVTRRWSLDDAPWLTPSKLGMAREAIGDLRYRVEYEAEFLGRVNAYLDPADILAAVADYDLLPPEQARSESIVLGADWSGGSHDPHAIVALGVLDDYGANERAVLFVSWLETALRPFGEQVEMAAALQARTVARSTGWRGDPYRPVVVAGYHVALLNSESNGVGAWPSEELARRLGPQRVQAVHSSQRSKEDGYGKVRAWLSDRRLGLPNDPELLRQLRGLTYEATAQGGLSIGAGNPNLHDDLADALYLAALAIPADFRFGPTTPEPDGTEWLTTPGGIAIPRHPRPRLNSLRVRGGVLRAFD
jgi:hypothetical protein